MAHPARIVAGVEVVPLCDAVGPMGGGVGRPLGELFGGADQPAWARLRAVDAAAADPADTWVLHFHCYLLRDRAGRMVLVDTGVGAVDSPAATWAPVPGRLTAELAAVGVGADEVDVVVLTHLHSDHASGCLTADGAAPAFPNARYLVQGAELDWLAAGGSPMFGAVIEPLRKAGCLDVIGDDRGPQTAPGCDIAVVPTPGHTPGHQSVRVGDHALVVTGDLVLHPVQLADPALTYRYDEDAQAAVAIRTHLLNQVRAVGGLLAPAHFAEPFVVVPAPAG